MHIHTCIYIYIYALTLPEGGLARSISDPCIRAKNAEGSLNELTISDENINSLVEAINLLLLLTSTIIITIITIIITIMSTITITTPIESIQGLARSTSDPCLCLAAGHAAKVCVYIYIYIYIYINNNNDNDNNKDNSNNSIGVYIYIYI